MAPILGPCAAFEIPRSHVCVIRPESKVRCSIHTANDQSMKPGAHAESRSLASNRDITIAVCRLAGVDPCRKCPGRRNRARRFSNALIPAFPSEAKLTGATHGWRRTIVAVVYKWLQ